jgi:hypothetical protein
MDADAKFDEAFDVQIGFVPSHRAEYDLSGLKAWFLI